MMREVWVTMWSRLVLAKMLPRVLTRLPIVPQLLQPLEQGQHIGVLGQADAVQPGGQAVHGVGQKKFRKILVIVGLSNILDSELIRREPAEGSHGQVVGAAVMDGKLLGKVDE